MNETNISLCVLWVSWTMPRYVNDSVNNRYLYRVLYAYLDRDDVTTNDTPSDDVTTNDTSATDVTTTDTSANDKNTQNEGRAKMGREITQIIQAYYRMDKIKSCYSLQKWLLRFNIRDRYVNIVYKFPTDVKSVRLDLEEGVDSQQRDCSDLEIKSLEIPGVKI